MMALVEFDLVIVVGSLVRAFSGGVKTSYALRAEVNGQKLTKFVSKDDWDKLDVPEEKVVKSSKS
jgi:hypothetical protein